MNLNVSQTEIITKNQCCILTHTRIACYKNIEYPQKTDYKTVKSLIMQRQLWSHVYFNPLNVLDTEPPTYSNSKTYYNVSVSSDGHVVLTPKLMVLGNTIHCVQTTSVINRQVHRLRSHC